MQIERCRVITTTVTTSTRTNTTRLSPPILTQQHVDQDRYSRQSRVYFFSSILLLSLSSFLLHPNLHLLFIRGPNAIRTV